jgi:Flp pilus assembly protein TadG
VRDVTNSERPAPITFGRRVRRLLSGERGTALIETAMTLPLLLLVSVGIFEFGRAFQTWQILTNAAREGARLAVMPNSTDTAVKARVQAYLTSGQLTNTPEIVLNPASTVDIGGGATANSSLVTVNYPFKFMVLQPVASLLVSGATYGTPFTLTASAEMRNESQ